MEQIWERIRTRASWAIGAIFIVVIIVLFFWSLIDHESFVCKINGFLKDLWTLATSIMAMIIMVVALMMIVGIGPFRRRGGGRGH